MGVYSYNPTTKELSSVAGGTLYADAPIGTILAYGGDTAPNNWMLCQGQAISRTDYADLFAVIGTSFGSGDGSTTFNIPDMREATTKGAGLTGLSNNHMDSDGLAVGEFIDDRLQDHIHTFNGLRYDGGTLGTNSGSGWSHRGDLWTTGVTNERKGDTTEVKAVGVNYIIKVILSGLPSDLDEDIDSKIATKQNVTDNSLETTNKTVVGAINEVNSNKQNSSLSSSVTYRGQQYTTVESALNGLSSKVLQGTCSSYIDITPQMNSNGQIHMYFKSVSDPNNTYIDLNFDIQHITMTVYVNGTVVRSKQLSW